MDGIKSRNACPKPNTFLEVLVRQCRHSAERIAVDPVHLFCFDPLQGLCKMCSTSSFIMSETQTTSADCKLHGQDHCPTSAGKEQSATAGHKGCSSQRTDSIIALSALRITKTLTSPAYHSTGLDYKLIPQQICPCNFC